MVDAPETNPEKTDATVAPKGVNIKEAEAFVASRNALGDGHGSDSVFMAAAFSTGGDWPCDEGRAPCGHVIVLPTEDGEDDTRPRKNQTAAVVP
jgi:hypothetical protein